MKEALKGVPDKRRPMPDGLVQLRVSSRTGELVGPENPDGYMEIFMADHLPAGNNAVDGAAVPSTEGGAQSSEPIF
jgi:membrane carboxypeptidase/penicillin-binding protein